MLNPEPPEPLLTQPQHVPALMTTGPSLLVGSSSCSTKSHVAMSKSTYAEQPAEHSTTTAPTTS
jgi:hypothetical protein